MRCAVQPLHGAQRASLPALGASQARIARRATMRGTGQTLPGVEFPPDTWELSVSANHGGGWASHGRNLGRCVPAERVDARSHRP